MNKKTAVAMLGVVGLSLLLAGCAGLFQPPAPKEAEAIAPGDPAAVARLDPRVLGETIIHPGVEYFPDRIIVGFTNDATGEAALAKVVALVGRSVGVDVPLGGTRVAQVNLRPHLTVPEALGMVMLLIWGGLDEPLLPGEGVPPTPPTERPRQGVEGLLFVEPDYIIPTPEPVPGPGIGVTSLDPKVYDPTADLRPFQWALDAINADAAWPHATGAGIIVAVMDTGVDGTHPDLVGQMVTGFEVRGRTILPVGMNADTHSHGTHCAAIIAALNDGRGIVGLAYNAKIMDIRIFDPGFVGTAQYAHGVVWAIANGARVLSNSWGGVAYSQAIKAAIDYALSEDVIVVASAGNDTFALWTRPGSMAGVIGVAASDPHNRKAGFSTPGTWVSIAAPGVRVLSAVRAQVIQAGTGRRLDFDYWDGTSMSAPYVAALAAMILELHPAATPYQVKRLIERTAKDIAASGFDTGTGHGLIQADDALTAPLPPDDGAGLVIRVVTASSETLWGVPRPVPFIDITLRKGGRIIERGQTDIWGYLNIGFPDAPGLGVFPVLEPGTYEVIVGGDDSTPFGMNFRTANRVTGRTTVTLTAGGVTDVDIPVGTTLEVTLSWTGGGADTDIDLAVGEPFVGPGGATVWTYAGEPSFWGTWTPDVMGPSGTETYTLLPIHGDYAFYPLAVVLNAGAPATVTVTVRQNTITETYTFALTVPGWYHAFAPGPPITRWPGWWNNFPGPFVF